MCGNACSTFPDAQRISAVRDAATELKPDLVCFSWRDIQIFSPHEGDSSLEHAFNFYFASKPLKRIAASFVGVQQLYRYYSHIRAALKAQIMIGGGAITAFADQLILKLPEGTEGRRTQPSVCRGLGENCSGHALLPVSWDVIPE